METEDELTRLYTACDQLDNSAYKDPSKYEIFIDAAKHGGSKQERICGIQMLFRHFHSFYTTKEEQSKNEELQRTLYSFLSDKDTDIRKQIIKLLPHICKNGRHIKPVVAVLAQVLCWKDASEVILAKASLQNLVEINDDLTIFSLFNAAAQDCPVRERMSILSFFEDKIKDNYDFSEKIRDQSTELYVKMIDEVSNKESSDLLRLIGKSNLIYFPRCLEALDNALENDNFSTQELLGVICEKIDRTPKKHRQALRVPLISIMTKLLKSSTLGAKFISDFIVSKLDLKKPDINAIAERVVRSIPLDDIYVDDLDEMLDQFDRLAVSHSLLNSDEHLELRRATVNFMLKCIDQVGEMTKEQQRIYFKCVATMSYDQPFEKTSNEKLVIAVFDKIWMHCPNVNDYKSRSSREKQAELNFLDTEPVMFVMHNLIDNGLETQRIIEIKEQNWRERMDMLVQSITVTTQRMRDSVQKKYDEKINRNIYMCDQIGLMVWAFLGNKISTPKLVPSWLNNGNFRLHIDIGNEAGPSNNCEMNDRRFNTRGKRKRSHSKESEEMMEEELEEEESMSRTTSWASNAAVNGDGDETEDNSRRKIRRGNGGNDATTIIMSSKR